MMNMAALCTLLQRLEFQQTNQTNEHTGVEEVTITK